MLKKKETYSLVGKLHYLVNVARFLIIDLFPIYYKILKYEEIIYSVAQRPITNLFLQVKAFRDCHSAHVIINLTMDEFICQ